ncbi:hypothetical protein [Mesorhizobium sp. BR-1-1-10]|uniref:hypothetical protein n=1 Tax=Mesorhizobium sp. BR-1-1-10 TaxID=2876660 RepID=UPI001CD12C1E|nr:hypothetical protein [Mesorhizobium sp. BR-1-1-10]MBZ9975470.1 hypothetical protein [Mesorhizobium sp. BR-1-1-10]
MIILTAQQADHVRGPTGNGAALDPRELPDGVFILPEAVLTDPNHAMHHDFLAAMPTRTVDIPAVSDE